MGLWQKILGSSPTGPIGPTPPDAAASKPAPLNAAVPRDYLREAGDVIFGDSLPAPFQTLLEQDPDQVIGNLLRVLNTEGGPSVGMMRKAAAYALGQIGEPATIPDLEARQRVEMSAGVKDAIVASISAINLASRPAHSQDERRQIVHDVYEGKRPPVLQVSADAGSSTGDASQRKLQASRLASKVVAASLADAPLDKILPLVQEVLRLDPDCDRSGFLLVASGAFAELATKSTGARRPEAASEAAKEAIRLGSRLLEVERTGDKDILYSAYRSLTLAYFCDDDNPKALEFCSRALEINPQSEQMRSIRSHLTKRE